MFNKLLLYSNSISITRIQKRFIRKHNSWLTVPWRVINIIFCFLLWIVLNGLLRNFISRKKNFLGLYGRIKMIAFMNQTSNSNLDSTPLHLDYMQRLWCEHFWIALRFKIGLGKSVLIVLLQILIFRPDFCSFQEKRSTSHNVILIVELIAQ